MRGIARFVEDLLRSRRPRGFQATEEDTGLARTAITLRSARPGSDAPRDDFVTSLHKRLAAELDPPVPRRGGSRRTFVRAAAVAASAAAGAGLEHVLGQPATALPPAAITPDHGSWQTVAASTDLPDGTVRAFDLGAVTGFVERTGGRLRAVSGICTHQGCRLTLAPAAAHLVCPCHGATFALDGTVIRHRLNFALTALPRLAVREAEGFVQVYAPAPPTPAGAGDM